MSSDTLGRLVLRGLGALGKAKDALVTSIEEHERVKEELTVGSSERRQVIEEKKEELQHVRLGP